MKATKKSETTYHEWSGWGDTKVKSKSWQAPPLLRLETKIPPLLTSEWTWVACKDSMPSLGKKEGETWYRSPKVLIYAPKTPEKIHIAELIRLEVDKPDQWCGYGPDETGLQLALADVSHWRALPNPPTEESHFANEDDDIP